MKNNSIIKQAPLEEEFVRTIAHDMKSKLTGMQAYTQLLQRRLKGDTKDSIRFLNNIESHIKSFTTITTDVTDLLKYTSSQCSVHREVISFTLLFAQLEENLKKTGQMPEIIIKTTSDVTFYVDKSRLEKTLTNLIVCAFEDIEKVIISTNDNTKQAIICIEKFYKHKTHEPTDVLEQIKILVAKAIIELHNGKITTQIAGKQIVYTISLPLRNKT